ncbi:hypothetical protein Lser_V15G14343 [Lactuca serriola]
MANEKIFWEPELRRGDFPPDFKFGVGTSAFQVEGAWNRDGKGINIWDCFSLRNPDKITGGANACIAVDNYARMKEDVQLLKKMGVEYYRFSISWSRILPGGKVSMGKSLEGINHYNRLLDELEHHGIKPFVTLFHWDLPNALEEEYMGFLSSNIVKDFVDYADVCFWEFGDRVKHWVTLNEPYRFTYFGYVTGDAAPGRGGNDKDSNPGKEPYVVAYNLLNCHAAAYRKYQDEYKDYQKGEVGITLDCNFFKPYRGPKNDDDLKAVAYAYDFMLGWFLDPLTSGTWPKNMEKFVPALSSKCPPGRLPEFGVKEIERLKGSYDFLGINYYTANYAAPLSESRDAVPLGYRTDCHYWASGRDPNGNDIGKRAYTIDKTEDKGSFVYLYPEGLTGLLDYIIKKYDVHEKHIVITENGFPQLNNPDKTYEQIRDDTERITYIKEHIEAIKKARVSYRNIMGYFVWSFMDSFEWRSGYGDRFGMIYVDYKNNLQRYPKKSANWFRRFLTKDKPKKKTLEKVGLLKRALEVNVEYEEEDGVNDEMIEAEEPIEVIPKLKKAKA